MFELPPPFPGRYQTNLAVGTQAGREGGTLTAHATPHTKGSVTTLIDPTAYPSYGITVMITDVGLGAADTGMLLDLMYGAASGTPDQVLVENLLISAAPGTISGGGTVAGKLIHLPCIYVPAGVAVGARIQATITVDICRIVVWLHQELALALSRGGVVTYGADAAASRGTSVPGGDNAFGAWTELGTAARNHRMLMPMVDPLGDTTIVNAPDETCVLIELGVGPDSSNVTAVPCTWRCTMDTGEGVTSVFPPGPVRADVPAGVKIFARLGTGGTENRGVAVYGFDG